MINCQQLKQQLRHKPLKQLAGATGLAPPTIWLGLLAAASTA